MGAQAIFVDVPEASHKKLRNDSLGKSFASFDFVLYDEISIMKVVIS